MGQYYNNPNQALFDILNCDGGCDDIQDAVRIIGLVILKFKIKNRDIINKLYTTYLRPYLIKPKYNNASIL